jgi:hypothetical protein
MWGKPARDEASVMSDSAHVFVSVTNMTSLPPKVPQRLQDNAHVVNAYNICLRLEASLQQAVINGDNVGNDIIYIRILGYLIHYVSTDQGLKTVVLEIISAMTDRALLDVGRLYYDHYIRACTFPRLLFSVLSDAVTSSSQQGSHTNTIQSCISSLV